MTPLAKVKRTFTLSTARSESDSHIIFFIP